MKTHKRIPALLLTASMALSMLTPAWAVEKAGTATGELQATVRIDYSQSMDVLHERKIQAELLQGQTSLGSVSLTQAAETQMNGCKVQVSLRDRLGGELTGTADPGALDLTVTGLPQGDYTLQFTGEGYALCKVPFTIQNYSHYIEVGTGDGTFALGDFDGNGKVDAKDREALSGALGSASPSDLNKYDLNGDGRIDIVDLAYVNHNVNTPAGSPTVLDTVCVGVQVNSAQATQDLNNAGTTVTGGSLDSLFQAGGSSATFKNSAGRGDVVIPIPLAGEVEAENLQITTPDAGSGSIQAGTVEVEYDGGSISRTFSFDNSRYANVHALSPDPGHNVITIPLGKRVAVKKITITVTKTADGEYATVESIRFLQDIVPEDLTEPNSLVKNLSAVPGDSRASLKWNALPNVSGYRVEYWEKDKESARRQLNVDVPQAQVTGLDNLKTYCFTVTPTDGAWQGQTCAPVEATPQPAKAPSAPDMVNISPMDGQLSVSWKKGENAVWYEVYYTNQANAPTSSYQKAGERVTATNLTIPNLVNGTTYYIYVVAGNEAGRSGPSRISEGTPKATDYSRPAGIPTEGILDPSRIKTIALAAPNNYDTSQYPNGSFSIQNVIDNDFRTHWTAKDWSSNEHVVVTFTQPTDLYSVIWVPRLDGTYPHNLRAYSVQVWYKGEDLNGAGHLLTGGVDNGGIGNDSDVLTWPNIPNLSDIPTCKFAVLPFDPVKNVVKISVAVEQKAYNIVSLSELMFMEYDPARCLPDNITALFADELHTQLKAGVKQADIDALKARLDSDEINYYLNPETLADELALAQELLDTQRTSGVVLTGIQSRSSGADSAKYGQGGSDLQPLGVAARAGQEITVYASGIPAGEKVTLYATQFNAEASTWRAQVGELVNGRNILTVPTIGSQATERGGSLYLTYSGSKPESIKLHIRRAVDIPVLELSDWYKLNDDTRKTRIGAYVDELTAYVTAQNITNSNAQTKCLNVTEISTPTVLLSLPAAAVLGANSADRSVRVENLYQNVLAWEDIMHICKTTQGINNTYASNDMTSRQNIRCMQMFAGAFMYAAGNHIGIGYGSCAGVVSGLPIAKLPEGATVNSLFGWGIAHEIGHNMDKLGQAEITNNLYSLMVQTFDGKNNTLPSRLENSGKYTAIFTKTAQSQPGASNDVFTQLGMYWQLHLAYDGKQGEAHGPMWFYNQFFQDWKAGTYTAGAQSYDDKVALTAAGVVQKDLTEFFQRWGMTLSDTTKQKLESYGKEDRALWYLSDQSRRERLNETKPATGTLTATAQLKGDNAIEITVTPTITGKVQGYEIIRNDKSIAFVLPGADGAIRYEDVIGSGNHRTYQYKVTAYDILGNRIGSADAGQVRVAYDKLVDPSTYTMTRNGDAVTFTLKNAAPVTGFKLTGFKLTDDTLPQGEYTVTVVTEKDKTLTARKGTFDASDSLEGGFVAYFNNPKADSGDTSIYTYDAKTVTITNIPEGLENNLQLISYAEDDISFYSDAAVGLLAEDWKYADGEKDQLKKGTLVILGSYRGDPVWCTAEVWGRFRNDDGTVTERAVEGDTILLADPASLYGDASDISDGLLIFTPKYQNISELPEAICLKLFRTEVPTDASSRRVTAQTLWTSTYDGSDLPTIHLEEAP